MKYFFAIVCFCAAAACALPAPRAANVVRRAAGVQAVSPRDAAPPGVPFDIEATIAHPAELPASRRYPILVRDSSGSAVLQNYIADTNVHVRAGDRIRATGVAVGERGGIYAHCTNIALVARGTPPEPVAATVEELLSGNLDGRMVAVRGEITDVFPDEIDKNFIYFILSDGGKSIYMPTTWKYEERAEAESMIGCIVEANAIFITEQNGGWRRNIGRMLRLSDKSDLKTIGRSEKDPFAVPDMSDARGMDPGRIYTLGKRRMVGTVRATWHGGRALAETDDGYVVRLDVASNDTPAPGTRIEAVGLPESDLYNVNLRRVRWRPAPGAPLRAESPTPVSASSMIGFAADDRRSGFHGRAVEITGIVRGLPHDEGDGRMVLEDGGFLLSVDFSKCPEALEGVAVGSTVSISGIAVMDVDNWRPSSIFPQIKEVFVVATSPDGLKVLSRPSWWTAGKSLTVIGLLLAVILGIVIWNRSLKALAERRGRELTEETVSRVETELKVRERTRLAVELHDTIAQNLTGAIMEIRTGVRLRESSPEGMREHLDMARKTLESCRNELRNCIWDLRNRALEQTDMDKAIRLTVTPQIGSAALAVRFAVPRELISDNSAHAILRIIRELAVNAVRHGRATAIKVAGIVEDGRLMFSVADDGCGFDPAAAPGVEDGHFGLQGIRERVADFDGEMEVESAPGKGAKVKISIKQKGLQTPDAGRRGPDAEAGGHHGRQ